MGLFDWTKKASSVLPIKLSNLYGKSEITPLNGLTDFLKLYENDPYISRSVDIIGNAISKSKRKVVNEDGDSIDHPILELFDNPNEEGSNYFFGSAGRYIVLGGEVFWEIVTPNNLRVPKELYNLRPDRIDIVPDDKKKSISGYIYEVGYKNEENFNKDELVHIKTFHPTNDWRGMPAAKPLSDIVNADRYGWEWIKSFLKDKGILKGFLTTEKSINKASAERLKSKWQASTSSDGVPLLPGGVDWKNIARPPKESGMVDLTEHISQTKLISIGVPKGLLGMSDKSSENIDVQLNLFYSMTVTPYVRLMEDKINNDLMPRFNKGGTFKFDTSDVGLLDFESFVTALSEQFDRGSLTPNQFIEETGVGEPYEDGDRHYVAERKGRVSSTESEE